MVSSGWHCCTKVHGLQEAAEQMWHRAKAIRTVTGATIGWTSILETPTVWVWGLAFGLVSFWSGSVAAEVSSLESMPFWDCSTWPFLASLEARAVWISKLSSATTLRAVTLRLSYDKWPLQAGVFLYPKRASATMLCY